MTEIERRNPLFARVASGRGAYYQPTPQFNLNPDAVQYLSRMPTQVGNFFARYTQATPQYQTPYQTPLAPYQLHPTQPTAQELEARQNFEPLKTGAAITAAYVIPQLTQNGLLRAGTGTTLGEATRATAYPLALWGAAKFGQSAINAVDKVANSPVGRWGAKIIDWIF